MLPSQTFWAVGRAGNSADYCLRYVVLQAAAGFLFACVRARALDAPARRQLAQLAEALLAYHDSEPAS